MGVTDTTRPAGYPPQILAVLLVACTSFALAQTVVIPALPAIAEAVGTSRATATWLLTAFLLSASVATPIVGKLGDIYGKGRVLAVVLLAFSVGGVLNAFADSIGVLIAGRVLQGVAGGVFPLAFGIVRDTFPREKVPGALGLVSAVFGIGGGIGLPMSGVIVEHLDVSWIFWVNVLALPAAIAAYRIVPPQPPAPRARIDWLGAVLLSGALTSLLLGVSQASSWGWGSAATLGLLLGGLVVGAAWVVVESRLREPLIRMDVLRKPVVAATNLAGLLVGLSMFASFLTIPQFAQTPERYGYGFGASVTAAGLLLMPISLTQVLAGAYVGRFEARFGSRIVLAVGTLLSAASFAGMALAHDHPWQFVAAGALCGPGLTLSMASMANLVVTSVRRSEVGIATGLNTVTRTVGGAFGAAAAATILATHTVAAGTVPREAAYTATFALSAGAALLAFVAAMLVPTVAKVRAAEAADAAEPALL